MARYYGGICINHTVLKRISSKKIFRTVVPRSGGVKNRVATALFKTRESSNVCCHAKFVYPCPHPNPSLAAQAMLVPLGEGLIR